MRAETERSVDNAAGHLGQARLLLVAGLSDALDRSRPYLEHAAADLASAIELGGSLSANDRAALSARARQLEPLVSRVAALLEHAAEYYAGWALAPVLPSEVYGADGLKPQTPPRRLVIDA